ncbi:MAG: hypothetical protein KGZ68_14980 [Dechloromonas sp.]|nr:hypothetical protein [Dechloromonas sp.]
MIIVVPGFCGVIAGFMLAALWIGLSMLVGFQQPDPDQLLGLVMVCAVVAPIIAVGIVMSLELKS